MNADRLLALFERISEAPDAIRRLRRFILDLAVRGKLVEQDPEDEPAEEQLERIIEAKILHGRKARATKKKQIDASGQADDFQLPDGWATAPLADLVTVLNGRAYKQSELLGAGTPVLRVGNLFTSNKWYYSNLELDDDKYCDDGDLIFAWSASFGPFIWNGGRAIYHYHIWKLPLHSPDDLSRDYLYFYLLNKTAEIKAAGHGISMVHMTKEKMEKLEVPLPPLAEQHRIVAKVDELMALCDRLEAARQQREQYRDRLVAASLQRLNQASEDPDAFRSDARFALQVLSSITTTQAQIKQLRQTILNLAVRGKLVEQDPEDEPAEEQLARIIEAKILLDRRVRTTKKKRSELADEPLGFPFPARWTSAPLSDLVTVLNGRAYKQSELLDTGTPVLRVGNLFTSNKWYYSDLELDDDKYCDDGDLIFAWSASFGPFIWNGGRAIYHYHIWKLPLHSPEDLSRDYLYLYLLNKTDEIKASGHGISMVHMTKEKMERLEVPLPPLAEQHRIVAKVDELMALCDQLEQQLRQAEQTRRGLLEAVLQEALTGPERALIAAARAFAA